MLAPITALVGLTCSGLVSGLTLAYPLLINTHFLDQQGSKINPPVLHVNLDIAQRLTLWERAFKAGFVVPALSIITAISLTTFALKTQPFPANHPREARDWQSRKKLLLTSAALTGSLVLFTLIAIKPTNSKLMALRVAANNKQPINVRVAESLLNKWSKLHNVRVVTAFSGFALALFSFIAI
ncbi:uncharacterized protein UTRI_05382 [Ustilago trichophora]|uniref:DUF1772 domain-containing protein n=1 Tax=Ustilago trichophora TaxID=86804 RepID=A0A5C3EKZ8_9BASI|nr:uncharacterized protein UTRI_05382 [Ustilago trichophora]